MKPATSAIVTTTTSIPDVLDLESVRIDPSWALRIPASLALRKRILPLCSIDGVVHAACLDVEDAASRQAISTATGCEVKLLEADPESLRHALNRIYGGASKPGSTAAARRLDAEEEDAAALCDEILTAALLRDASDIHLLPTETSLQVQFRVDGQLELFRELPMDAHGSLISRLKVLSGLDIAEKRSPQDGRFNTHVGPQRQKMDMRVATLPTRFGERMTLRVLALKTGSITLESLGMNARCLEQFREAIYRPHGMILLTGPTGSGKSTTLFAAITELLAQRGGNVITVEDPIEYDMSGVSQVEVDSADKVSFGKALRSILRHDPDVVMIGEIRDGETADIAAKASLTGHLVFSTLHTNTAAGVVTRLRDMGIEKFLVAATLRLAIAQRLCRRLCPHCRKPRDMETTEAMALGRPELAGQTIYEPGGCVYCAGRGFNGRIAMFEMLGIDNETAQLIGADAEEADLIAAARKRETPLLIDDAIEKLTNGVTSLSEVTGAVVEF